MTTTLIENARSEIIDQAAPQPTQESRPTRYNRELWRKETYCCGHWWSRGFCLYGNHDLAAEARHE